MNVHTPGFALKLNVQARGQGRIKGLSVYNKAAATKYYILMFEQLDEPIATAVPLWAPVPVVADGLTETVMERDFYDGCWLMLSTTPATLTIPGASDAWISVALRA